MNAPITGYDDIVTFGYVLVEAGNFNAKELLGYFEGPHKWDKEYQRWRQLGGTLDKEVIEGMVAVFDGSEADRCIQCGSTEAGSCFYCKMD